MLALAGCANQEPLRTTYSARSTRQATHTVTRGETLYHIARQYGVSTERLMAANGLRNPANFALARN